MSRRGIKRIALVGLGTLGSTNTNPVVFGHSGEKVWTSKPHKTVPIFPNRQGPNMDLHRFEGISHQQTLKDFYQLLQYTSYNCDAEVLTENQSGADSEDAIQYGGNNVVGIGFKYEISQDSRGCQIYGQRAFPVADGKAIVDAADSNTKISLTGDKQGRDYTKYRSPRYLSIESPAETALFTGMGIKSRKLTIESDDEMNQFEAPAVDYVKITLEVVGREASIVKIVELLTKNSMDTVLWKEANAESYYDAFSFAANVLSLNPETNIGDKERFSKAVFTGGCHISEITLETGAGNGGAEADGGLNGGTLKFGF